jgi:hypothetical protein
MAIQVIKTVNKIATNVAYPTQTNYVGFIPYKIQYSDSKYKTQINAYKLKEVFDTDGVTLLGYVTSDIIPMTMEDATKILTTEEVQNVYDTLVAAGKIVTTDSFTKQEMDLLLHGGVLTISQYNLFGITSDTELEIISLYEETI